MAAQPDAKRTTLINGPHFNAWFHIYKKPGQPDEMHCHNGDQTFYCVEGECTMHFPDGGKAVLTPGKAALITGGSCYQLENTGADKMVMLGVRSISQEAAQTISYEDHRELFPCEKADLPRGTTIVV